MHLTTRHARVSIFALLGPLLAGCVAESNTDSSEHESAGSDTDTDTTDGPGEPGDPDHDPHDPGTSSSTGDEPGGGDEECHEVQTDCGESFEPLTCDEPEVCDTLLVDDPDLSEESEEFGFRNPEAATCILEALRDGMPATHVVHVQPGGQYSVRWQIEVVPQRRAIVRGFHSDDDCPWNSERFAELQDASVFSTCLEADEASMYACLNEPLNWAQCLPASLACG